jgi:hypothetical protein
MHGGPSAGQTAIIILLDMALGIVHGPKLGSFQQEMREYMPSEARQLLQAFGEDIRECGSLRSAAESNGAPESLVSAHTAAVKSLGAMRAAHFAIATHFLKRSLKGTGGSDFRAMLSEGLAATKGSAVPSHEE